MWSMAAAAAAAAYALSTFRRGGSFAGAGCNKVTVSNLISAQPGATAQGEEARIVMFGINRRTYVRIKDRRWRNWLHGRRWNSAAKQRFLFKPDGTVWHRQAKQGHLKSKKSPAHLRRLKAMVRITRKDYKRIKKLCGK